MLRYHAALAHFPKITYSRYQKLAAYFSDLKNLWDAEMPELIAANLEENIAHEFLLWRETTPVEKLLEKMEKENITTVSLCEPDYSPLLKEISDPPHTIFYRGTLPDPNKPALAVVGTRKMSEYGKRACEEIVSGITRQGIVVISGMALGIDGIAHQAALDAGGKTTAVLGCGIDKQTVYPAAHKLLSEQILQTGGCVLAEYPPGFLPTQYSFPARNRIVAGLSLGTLVIEAPEESGALITARLALEYNREVFAVPHSIYAANGIGPNNLIRMGAKPVSRAEDIIEALNLKSLTQIADHKKITPSSPAEEKVINVLISGPAYIDRIIKESGMDSQSANSTLLLMEMKGKVRNLGGMNFTLSR